MIFDKLCSFVKKIDLFGVPVGLVMDKSTHYRSLIGSVVSIVGIIFIFGFFWTNLLSYIYKDKVIYTTEKTYSQSPDAMNITQNTFMFALGFEQPNLDFTIYPFFNITVVQTYYIMNGEQRTYQYMNVDMVPCTEEHFMMMGKANYDRVAILNSKNFLCPKLDQPMVLQGLYTSEVFSFLKVVVTKCDPNFKVYDKRSWKPIDCATKADYDAFIASVKTPRFIFYTSNFNVIPSNKENYAQAYIQDQQSFTFVPNFMVKSADIYITKQKINTDEDIIYEAEGRNETYYTIDLNEIDQVSNYIIGSSSFVTLFIRRSPNTIVIKRSFTKLAELLIQIGGLVKCVFLVLGFLVTKYNKFHFRLELANKLYDFAYQDEDRQKSENKNHNGSSTSIDNLVENPLVPNASQNTPNIFNQFPISPSNPTRTNDTQKDVKKHGRQQREKNLSIASLNKLVLKENKSMKSELALLEPISAGAQISVDIVSEAQREEQKSILLNYFQKIMSKTSRVKVSVQYFLNYITFGKCFRTEENYLVKKAQAFTKIDLDIYVILDKLQEIEKIKKIIFTPEQKILFNFFHKPVIRQRQKAFQIKSLRDFSMQLRKARNNATAQTLNPEKTNVVSDHLLKERDAYTTVEAYENLYKAYKTISKTEDSRKQIYNQKLMDELGDEVQQVFELQKSLNKKQKSKNFSAQKIAQGAIHQLQTQMIPNIFKNMVQVRDDQKNDQPTIPYDDRNMFFELNKFNNEIGYIQKNKEQDHIIIEEISLKGHFQENEERFDSKQHIKGTEHDIKSQSNLDEQDNIIDIPQENTNNSEIKPSSNQDEQQQFNKEVSAVQQNKIISIHKNPNDLKLHKIL